MRHQRALNSIAALAALMAAAEPVAASQAPAKEGRNSAEAAVRQADARFWSAYNRCDERGMAALFTADAEFYHDKTGLSVGPRQIAASMMRGPCSNPSASRIRREESSNTVRFDPLAGGFAFMSGEHRFFLTPAGQAEQPSGVARFATVWQQRGATWLMRRVVSYAHGPGVPELTAVPLPSEALRRLAGAYAGEQGASAEVRLEGDRLVLTSGGAVFHLVPLAPNRFGVADRPVQFVFEADTLQVMENGSAVAQMRRKAAAP